MLYSSGLFSTLIWYPFLSPAHYTNNGKLSIFLTDGRSHQKVLWYGSGDVFDIVKDSCAASAGSGLVSRVLSSDVVQLSYDISFTQKPRCV